MSDPKTQSEMFEEDGVEALLGHVLDADSEELETPTEQAPQDEEE